MYFLVVAVIGQFYWCYVVSHITADVILKTSARSKFQHKVERVTLELKKHYLPKELRERVKKYYDILWRNRCDLLHFIIVPMSDTYAPQLSKSFHIGNFI